MINICYVNNAHVKQTTYFGMEGVTFIVLTRML